MNFKDSLNALHTLDSLLQENPVEVCKVYCAHKGLEEPCDNTEECLCERFGEDYKSNCSNEYCAEDKYAALNEDNQICSTNDLTELCEIKELAQDFIAHFDEYMNTCKSKLSIGDPEVEGQQCPTEDLDLSKANSGCLLTREEALNLSEAEKETPIDDDSKLIEDADKLNKEWFEKNWKNVSFGLNSRSNRRNSIVDFLNKVKEQSISLYEELKPIFEKWEARKIDYSTLKNAFLEKFADNSKTIEGDKEVEAKKKVVEIYNNSMANKYGQDFTKVEKYSDLPQNWKEKFDDYIARGRIDLINSALEKSKMSNSDLEKSEAARESVLSKNEKINEYVDLVKKILEINLTNIADIKKAANLHEMDSVEVKSYFLKTKDALVNDEITLTQIKKWLYLVARDFYQIKNAEWLRDIKAEKEEAEDLTTLSELEYSNISEEVKNTSSWKKFAPVIAKRFKPGSSEYDKYMKQLIIVASKEASGEEMDEDDDSGSRVLKDSEFVKLFSNTKMFKAHRSDIEPLLKEAYKKYFANVEFDFDKHRFVGSSSLNAAVLVLEECLNTEKISSDDDYKNFLKALKRVCVENISNSSLGNLKSTSKINQN